MIQKKKRIPNINCSSSVLYLTKEDLTEIMNDEVIVVAEGVNGTVMKMNEIQVSMKRYPCEIISRGLL